MKRSVRIFLLGLGLSLLGLIIIYSTSAIYSAERFGDGFYFVKRQSLWLTLGLAVQIFFMKLHYQRLYHWAPVLMSGCIVLLLCVLVPELSVEVGGARRWIRIFGFTFQPSEFCKLGTVIFMAKVLSERQENIRSLTGGFLLPFSMLLIISGLVLAEKDLGGTVIIGAVAFSMFYMAGIRPLFLALLMLGTVVLLTWAIVQYPFRMQRILVYLDPWKDPQNSGYQIIQSMMAIGSGGFWGRGLGQSIQKFYYLPEAHTDFIFSIYAEETGFFGAFLLILLFALLLYNGARVALKSKDLFAQLLAYGITVLLGLQVFINIGVVTSLLPTKGTPLPFITFGGTSLVSNMAALGILISVEKYSVQGKGQGRL